MLGPLWGLEGIRGVFGAGSECRYSGARRGIGGIRGIGLLGGVRAIRGIVGCQGCIRGWQGV